MMRVPYFLGQAKTGGLGVFASEDVREGTLVWRYDPNTTLCLSENAFDDLPVTVQNKMLSYTYLGKGVARVRGRFYFNADDSRFMNHSQTPNISISVGDDYRAKRLIRAGEEITCDYHDFCEEDDPCLVFPAATRNNHAT